MLTKKELAEKVKVSLPTIDKWKSKGMPYVKIGKNIRFDWEDVKKWLKEQQGKSMIITPDIIKDYCVVCNEVARRDDLSARAKGIYYYLATLPKNWQLSQQELLNHFTEGRHSINTAFKELVKTGYIEKNLIKDQNGMFKGNSYKVHWSCQKPVNQKTEIGKPVDGKTEIGKSATNKYLLEVSTKEVNTKEEEVLKKQNKPKRFNRFDFLKS